MSIEGKKPERHPYTVMKEKLDVLKNKKLNLERALNSLEDQFFSGRSSYEQGVGYNKFQDERDRLNGEITNVEMEIENLKVDIISLEEKMKREN